MTSQRCGASSVLFSFSTNQLGPSPKRFGMQGEARREACERVVSYLEGNSAAGKAIQFHQSVSEDLSELTSNMNWNGLLELVLHTDE